MKRKAEKPKKLAYQVQMEPDLLARAKEKAAEEDLKLSQVIRRFLMDYVSNPQGKLFN